MRRNQRTTATTSSQKSVPAKKDKDIGQFFAKTPPSPAADKTSNMADDEAFDNAQQDRLEELQEPTCAADTANLLALIAALPQKDDLANLLAEIKTGQQRETQVLKAEIHTVAAKLNDLEEQHHNLSHTVATHSSRLTTQARHIFNLRRMLEDAENRNRRCNLCIRGVSEDRDSAELRHTLTDLFNQLLGQDKEATIQIDRLHRVSGGRPNKLRDILCALILIIIIIIILPPRKIYCVRPESLKWCRWKEKL